MPTTMRRETESEQQLNLANYSKAVVNILEDSATERAGLQGAQIAVLNILEDSAAERAGLQEAQKAVLNILDDLAGEVEDRKHFEQTLQEKNVELENAMLSKDRFLASMSHELRTPLNAIIGFTGTLLMKLPGPLNDDQQKQLGTIQSSARHLLSLINDLLDLAKIDSGKVKLNLERVACQAILEEITMTLRPLAEKKGLALLFARPKRDLEISTDRRALSQILLNLANNGIKFTDKGAVTLELGERADENAARFVEIKVSDTGVGIREEDQVRLFQAFEQMDFARRHEGTGLGLHVSHRLAGLIGARIEFESHYGKGSRFSVLIPMDRR